MSEGTTTDELKPALKDWQRRLAEARALAGMALSKVAKEVGVSLQNISQVEQGKQSITVDKFLLVCAALQIRTEWALHGTGDMWIGERPKATRRWGRPADRTYKPRNKPEAPERAKQERAKHARRFEPKKQQPD